MKLLGPELVRDLVSLLERAEGDEAFGVLVSSSADPDFFIPHVDLMHVAAPDPDCDAAGASEPAAHPSRRRSTR